MSDYPFYPRLSILVSGPNLSAAIKMINGNCENGLSFRVSDVFSEEGRYRVLVASQSSYPYVERKIQELDESDHDTLTS